MKLRIVEQAPGELASKAPDLIKLLDRLAPGALSKAAPSAEHDHTPAKFDHPALAGAVKHHSKEAERIRRVMSQRIAAVLKG